MVLYASAFCFAFCFAGRRGLLDVFDFSNHARTRSMLGLPNSKFQIVFDALQEARRGSIRCTSYNLNRSAQPIVCSAGERLWRCRQYKSMNCEPCTPLRTTRVGSVHGNNRLSTIIDTTHNKNRGFPYIGKKKSGAAFPGTNDSRTRGRACVV